MNRNDGGPQVPATPGPMCEPMAVVRDLLDLILGTPPGAIPDDLEGFVARGHERLTTARFEAAKVAEPAGPAAEVRAKAARARACVTASPPVAAILAEAERDGFLTVVDGQPAGDEIRHRWAKRCVAAGRPLVEVFIREDDPAGVMLFTELATPFGEDADCAERPTRAGDAAPSASGSSRRRPDRLAAGRVPTRASSHASPSAPGRVNSPPRHPGDFR